MKRIIVGISGASGVELGHRVLEALHALPGIETHLVISEGAHEIFRREKAMIHRLPKRRPAQVTGEHCRSRSRFPADPGLNRRSTVHF